jgi:hypothetical protein
MIKQVTSTNYCTAPSAAAPLAVPFSGCFCRPALVNVDEALSALEPLRAFLATYATILYYMSNLALLVATSRALATTYGALPVAAIRLTDKVLKSISAFSSNSHGIHQFSAGSN